MNGMPGRCSNCLESKGSFHFYCPNCFWPDTMPKWNAPSQHNEIYRRESEEIDKLRSQREASVQDQNFTQELDTELQEKWDEWRSLSKTEQVEVWLKNRQRPLRQYFGVSNKRAAVYVSTWLNYLGEERIRDFSWAKDNGVDVRTASACCQVRNYEKTLVSLSETREIYGISRSEESNTMIFTSSSLSKEAIEFCEANEIIAVKYDAEEAELLGLSSAGTRYLVAGQYQAPPPLF